MTPLNNIAPINKINIEIIDPRKTATKFIWPFIFSTKLPMDDGDELNIYISDKWNGKYELYQKVKFKDNIARNAGAIFQIDNKFIRPAQIYNGDYGKGLVMQEVIFKDNKFSFNELKRFYPTSKEWNLGMHTFNVNENLAVVDAKKYRKRNMAQILIFLKEVIKSLGLNINIW